MIERARRVPTCPLPPGTPPRSILVKLLHYRDRDSILCSSREKGEIILNGHKVAIYPDFSLEVQRKRLQFVYLKRRLQNLKIPYSMIFPAKLRVSALGSSHFFDLPKAALPLPTMTNSSWWERKNLLLCYLLALMGANFSLYKHIAFSAVCLLRRAQAVLFGIVL